MPTLQAVLQFYIYQLKKRTFRRIKLYPSLKLQHNSNHVEKTLKAKEFRAKFLLLQFLKIWISNTITPNKKLLQESKILHNKKLLFTTFNSLILIYENIQNLDQTCENHLQTAQFYQKTAIFTNWKQQAKMKIQTIKLSILTKKVNLITQKQFLNYIVNLYNKVLILNENCDQFLYQKSIGVQEKVLRILLESYRKASFDKKQIKEALDFHEQAGKQEFVTQILQKAYQVSLSKLDGQADVVASQAKQNYLNDEKIRRYQKIQDMREVGIKNSQEQMFQRSKFEIESGQQRNQPRLLQQSLYTRQNQQLAYTPFKLENQQSAAILQQQQEQLIQEQINQYKKLKMEHEDLQNTYEKEMQKMHYLKNRLDKTMHPWSAQLEADAQQLLIDEIIADLNNKTDQIDAAKEKLKQFK